MKRDLTRIVVCFVCLHSAMAGMRMAAPLLALTLDVDKVRVGLLIASFALPQIIIALPSGRFADRRGLQLPVSWACAIAVLAGLVAAAFPHYALLCVAAMLSGSTLAIGAIAMQRHCGRAAKSAAELKHAFGWLSTAPAISNFFGPFATGLVIDQFGYRAAFGLLALLPVIGWIAVRGVRDLPLDNRSGAHGGTPWSLWKQPWFGRLLLMNWFAAASFDVHGFVVPVLGHERGLSASIIGTILGSFAVAAAVSRIALPVIAARMKEWVLITGALVLGALVFCLYPFATTAVTMALCSAGIGMTIGGMQPIVMGLLHETAPAHRHGDALAMRHLMINISQVTMPLLLGAFAGTFGVSMLFWVMGASIGLGVPVGRSLKRIEQGKGNHS